MELFKNQPHCSITKFQLVFCLSLCEQVIHEMNISTVEQETFYPPKCVMSDGLLAKLWTLFSSRTNTAVTPVEVKIVHSERQAASNMYFQKNEDVQRPRLPKGSLKCFIWGAEKIDFLGGKTAPITNSEKTICVVIYEMAKHERWFAVLHEVSQLVKLDGIGSRVFTISVPALLNLAATIYM